MLSQIHIPMVKIIQTFERILAVLASCSCSSVVDEQIVIIIPHPALIYCLVEIIQRISLNNFGLLICEQFV